jgi:hypothetical protein
MKIIQVGAELFSTDRQTLIAALRDIAKAPKSGNITGAWEKPTAWRNCSIVFRTRKTPIKFLPPQSEVPKTECRDVCRIMLTVLMQVLLLQTYGAFKLHK